MKIVSPIQRRRSRIVIIPLIDIMFFLLASFMMVSLQMEQTQNIKVHLPPSGEARQDFKPDMMNIAVDQAGRVWVEKEPVTLAQLGLMVSNRFQLNTNLPVYVSGDRATLEGAMDEVLDVVRRAGIQKVAFTVSEDKTQTRP
ncbi:MAG: biopolymer transporter ExbD [Verrucomicrobiia bacterium]